MSLLKHVPHEGCFAIENGALAKRLRIISEDIIFRNRDANGVGAQTFDPLVLTIGIGSTTIDKSWWTPEV